MKKILLIIMYMIVAGFMIYGSYWLFKHGSYYFFYESMVIETIKEKVKENALNN